MDWFTVNKAGLAKLLERRGKAFAILELLSNAWDTDATCIDVSLLAIPGVPEVAVSVTDDDPNGFTNLAHAFTLFAESEKKGKADKRGRFNLGEKLVLALCDQALIISTTGAWHFDEHGRHRSTRRTERGSQFRGTMRMTRAELDEAMQVLRTVLPPPGIATFINGEPLQQRVPLAWFDAVLPTEIGDGEGILRRSERKTTVRVYAPLDDETPSLYELGIPVVETGDRWHYDVGQKVPLNMDRDNVPPAFLRRLRTLVADHMRDRLTEADANTPWARDALVDAAPETVERLVALRFGEKRVAYDPSDPEANKIAVSQGYVVIHGSMLGKREWERVREVGAAPPAGRVTPSPKPYGDGPPLKLVPPNQWSDGIKRTVLHAERLGCELLGSSIVVQVANDMSLIGVATFRPTRVLVLNLARLGHAWFNDVASDDQHRLLVHEFGHAFSLDHLSSEYHDALCQLGARLARLALTRPELLRAHLGKQ